MALRTPRPRVLITGLPLMVIDSVHPSAWPSAKSTPAFTKQLKTLSAESSIAIITKSSSHRYKLHSINLYQTDPQCSSITFILGHLCSARSGKGGTPLFYCHTHRERQVCILASFNADFQTSRTFSYQSSIMQRHKQTWSPLSVTNPFVRSRSTVLWCQRLVHGLENTVRCVKRPQLKFMCVLKYFFNKW